MSTLSTALAAQRLSTDSPAWALLRAQHAAPAVAILGEHLAGEDRRLPAPVLFSKVHEDLTLLRDHGFDLPQTAQQYCATWRELVEHARVSPRAFVSQDPLVDAWELNGTPRPDMLYLDKCWQAKPKSSPRGCSGGAGAWST